MFDPVTAVLPVLLRLRGAKQTMSPPERTRAVISELALRPEPFATRNGTFGGVVKAKTFAGSMSSVLVSADEILQRAGQMRDRRLQTVEAVVER